MKHINYLYASLLLICSPSMQAADALAWGHNHGEKRWGSFRKQSPRNRPTKPIRAESILNAGAEEFFPRQCSASDELCAAITKAKITFAKR